MTNTITRFNGVIIALISLFFFGTVLSTANAATDWDVTGTYVWDVFGTYFHDLTIDVQNPDGTFSGYAGYPAGQAPYDQPGETTETVEGLVDGDTFTFSVVYHGPYASGSVFYMAGTIDGDGHISGTSPWNWQFTGGAATYMRSAEITSPEADEIVYGVVDLTATLNDKDGDDSVQWAVREGTCAAGTNTVAGNVDGFSDSFDWDGAAFSAEWDSTGADPGMYCFIFNPTETAGDLPIRETREFYVDNDTDDDGVLNEDDFCPDTGEDGPWDEEWGKNRWEVQNDGGALVWYQNKVGKKGITTPTAGEGIDYTYGCNGHQILEALYEELGSVMNGHWKFGLSSSVVEDFHNDLSDGDLDGRYYLETVVVPANDVDGVASQATLLSGHDYVFKASGTANAGDNIEFDAQYSFRTGSSVEWTDAVSTYEGLGTELLDLFVDGVDVDWGVYNGAHEYEYLMTGSGATVNFGVYDVYYPNNTGNLAVDIYAQI